MVIYLIGLTGAGKTYYGKRIAQKHHLPFADLDDLIENATNNTIANIFATEGENYFREIEAKELRKTAELKNAIVACGGGTPCFYDNMNWINKNGISVYLNVPIKKIITNITLQKAQRPLLASINNNELYPFLENLKKQRESFYKQCKHEIASENAIEVELKNLISSII